MQLKPFTEHIRKTLAINPEPHSLKVSENRWMSFGYALAGFLHMLRYAKNLRIQLIAVLVVLIVGLWLELSRLEWVMLTLVIGLNIFAEFMNAAIEATVNLISPEFHLMAQLAKDIAAGAVLLTTFTALIVALLIFGAPLLEKFT